MKTKFFFTIFFFLVFFLSGFYFYYLYRFQKAPDRKFVFNYYPEDLVLKSGTRLHPPDNRIQHFLNFPTAKSKDSIRIGAFGDSYTYSKAVSKEASYPRQLQRMLEKRFPNKKIEVLNFGINGGGFDETFFLWEKYAETYEIDYILFGPRTFHPNRELTFRAQDNNYYEHPKSRFILSKGKLRLVSIQGNSLKKRYKNYYSIFPSWTALRYDVRPFKVWEWILKSDIIKNPFYYRNSYKEEDWTEESSQIYLLLLQKIEKAHPKKVLIVKDIFGVGFDKYPIFKHNSFKNFYNINYINYPYHEKSYYRHKTHYSSLGYEIPSVFFFHALIGKKDFSFNLINCQYSLQSKIKAEGTLEKSKSLKTPDSFKLSDLKSISIHPLLKKKPNLLNFYTLSDYHIKELNINPDVKNFLGFSSPVEFGNTAYLPLSYPLKDNLKVYIKLPNGKRIGNQKNKERLELGKIQALDKYQKFFSLYGRYITYYAPYFDKYYGTYFILKDMPPLIKNQIERAFVSEDRLELLLEDKSLGWLELETLEAEEDDVIDLFGRKILRFLPHRGYNQSLLIMGNPDSISEKNLPFEFPLNIKYQINEKTVFKASVLNWDCKKQAQFIELNLKNFTPL